MKVNHLTPTVAVWVHLQKHPVPDRVKPPFVIFDVKITNDGLIWSGTGRFASVLIRGAPLVPIWQQ